MVTDILFAELLTKKMDREHWTQADLARAAGLGPATVYRILTETNRRPKPESCLGIAKALNISPIIVYRAAGLLPPEPDFPELEELNITVAQLPEQQRQVIVATAKVMLEIHNKGYAIVK